LLSAETWAKLSKTALELFAFGQKTAQAKGLLLVDTKYEFGLDDDGEIVLIDEIHTQDSSRYWLGETYAERIAAGDEPDNYDKEYMRLWFKDQFDPYNDTEAPTAPDDIIAELVRRYTYVYEKLTGQTFVPSDAADPVARIETNILAALAEE
jgi:phosphoribosylaminoimidazole-succinocarboxamide synthase